jgi:hypothetical protein
MGNPDNEHIIIQIEETLHLFLWPNNITTFSPFSVMFYLPCADHVLLLAHCELLSPLGVRRLSSVRLSVR